LIADMLLRTGKKKMLYAGGFIGVRGIVERYACPRCGETIDQLGYEREIVCFAVWSPSRSKT
jgi:hypothetical protein